MRFLLSETIKILAGLGRDDLIVRPSIWAGPIRACNNLCIFSFSGYFSILILKVLILKKLINAQKIEILLHVRIDPDQIDGLIIKPSLPSFCVKT